MSSTLDISRNLGQTGQGHSTVPVGNYAGETYQGHSAVPVGNYAGETYQGHSAVQVGQNRYIINSETKTIQRIGNGDSALTGSYYCKEEDKYYYICEEGMDYVLK